VALIEVVVGQPALSRHGANAPVLEAYAGKAPTPTTAAVGSRASG